MASTANYQQDFELIALSIYITYNDIIASPTSVLSPEY